MTGASPMNNRFRVVSIGLHILMSMWTLFVLAPILLMLISAFKTQAEIST
jgi:ABC-type glycerol-3-phosphate transport system permease component